MANMKPTIALLLSLLLIIFMAESRLLGEASEEKDSTINCDEVLGVQSGDTCFSIMQTFNLSAEDFGAINPNLNCDALFVGQWLCVSGTSS